ncbi:succinylglutamate desuccinylase/aspartoacylase family protein [Pseudomonas bubulae]|uniref:succinylglutamate desuccinylase/aspartoacylase family protein n=1 Tax=Pseudomonas bubulae TaxID=2316085 RepID=UPI001F39C564|nr:succinylglutamate desuccinylase/aspartoacylase family protein [Pseudomonas bubulae]MCF3195965.1 succinylglutamate desuccinylase/aspartoacylase family protein [Pseudomonas bubulae]
MSSRPKDDVSMITSTVDFDKQGIQFGVLNVPHSAHRSAYGCIPIPIAVLSRGEGPTVLLTGGVHGDEYEGPVALSKLARRIDVAEINGRIIIIPALNYPAFQVASRVSPIDSINLNRIFPGRRDGSITEMIAHYVNTKLLPIADYLFDFHAGGSSLSYLPGVLSPLPGQGKNPEASQRLLNAFTPSRVYYYDAELAPTGDDRVLGNYAFKNNVEFLCGEFGGGGTINRVGLAEVEHGLIGYLRETSVLQTSPLEKNEPTETQYFTLSRPGLMIYAHRSGIFEPAFDLGDEVSQGTVAGFLFNKEDLWAEPEIIRFESDGVVVCTRTSSDVIAGDCLGHLAYPLQ